MTVAAPLSLTALSMLPVRRNGDVPGYRASLAHGLQGADVGVVANITSIRARLVRPEHYDAP